MTLINPYIFGGSSAFSPNDIAGLRFWYDAESLGLSNGAGVATWTDQSVNGLDLTQATGANQPTYQTNVLNGLAVVDFDGTNDYVGRSTTSISPTTGWWTAFAVVQVDTVTGVHAVIGNDGATGSTDRMAQVLRFNGTAVESIAFNTTPTAFTDGAGVTAATGTWYILTATRTADQVVAFVDGSSNGATGTSGTTAKGSNAPLRLGADIATPTAFLDGRIAEAIGYSAVLTATERGDVESYLADKYGL